jgi:hypothetical protein
LSEASAIVSPPVQDFDGTFHCIVVSPGLAALARSTGLAVRLGVGRRDCDGQVEVRQGQTDLHGRQHRPGLIRGQGRYWFSTQPTLYRLAEIVRMLAEDADGVRIVMTVAAPGASEGVLQRATLEARGADGVPAVGLAAPAGQGRDKGREQQLHGPHVRTP